MNYEVVHFIGIGGISMSGIANLLHSKGHKVQGSDMNLNENTDFLSTKGINVVQSHNPENILGADCVVYTSTVRGDNPEILAAQSNNINTFTRQKFLSSILAEYPNRIGVTGTHGKTTTTAFLWHLFRETSDLFLGSKIVGQPSSIICNESQSAIIEADESDASCAKIDFENGIISNIDLDHMDFYKSEEDLMNCFEVFARNILAKQQINHGNLIIGIDYPRSRKLFEYLRQENFKKVFSYSRTDTNADFYPANIKDKNGKMSFQLYSKITGMIVECEVPIFGMHNIDNAGMAIAMHSLLSNSSLEQNPYNTFKGIEKRMNYVGKAGNFEVYDDYAHHPAKIYEMTTAMKQFYQEKPVVYIFEPHKYSRLSSCYDEYLKCFRSINTPNSILLVLDVYGVPGRGQELFNKQDFIKDIQSENPNLFVGNIGSPKEIELNDILSAQIGCKAGKVETLKDKVKDYTPCIVFGAGFSSLLAKKMVEL